MKKLNRRGYKFNKITKQYELIGPGEQKEEKILQKKEVSQIVTPSYIPKIYTPKTEFTNKHVEILHRMIKEYELKEHIRVSDANKGELGNRNVGVYIDHFNQFSNWCKSHGITQADGLYEAINILMKTINK